MDTVGCGLHWIMDTSSPVFLRSPVSEIISRDGDGGGVSDLHGYHNNDNNNNNNGNDRALSAAQSALHTHTQKKKNSE